MCFVDLLQHQLSLPLLLALYSFAAFCWHMATIEDFEKLDIRVGRIVDVQRAQTKKPAYRLTIDLGEIGTKTSCAQLCANYTEDQLRGKLVLCVVNFPERKMGPEISEVLTLGVPDGKGECVLIAPERDAPIGGRMY